MSEIMAAISAKRRYRIQAVILCPKLFSSRISRSVALELEKPKYRRIGISLESIGIEEMDP